MDDQESFQPPVEAHDWKYIVLHHSATESGNVATLDDVDRRRRDQFGQTWLGIGYHFVIGNGEGMSDGQIESTFRWKEQLHGAHAQSRRHNRHGIGICLIGDLDQAAPTPRQMAALGRLAESLMARFHIDKENVVRHQDVAATRCPGRLFPFSDFIDSLQVELLTTIGQSDAEEFQASP